MATMDWIRGRRLGQGSFATVDAALHGGGSGFMAVKSCSASRSASVAAEKVILDELKGCPNVIDCFGECFTVENGEKMYNVFLEYADGGSVAEMMANRRLPEFEVRRYTKELVKGIRGIHDLGFVHCDLKLQNLLLFKEGGGLKIADFGLAKKVDGGDTAVRGTPMYMSPEMVVKGEQGTAADVWAVGCAVVEMASGCPVWPCSDTAALFMKIGGGESVPEIPEGLSSEGRDFIGKCFIRDPRERWTAAMLLNHPFLKEIDGEEKASVSPRCPFDFTECSSVSSSCQSPEYFPDPDLVNVADVSPLDRIGSLIDDDWPCWSNSSRWIDIR